MNFVIRIFVIIIGNGVANLLILKCYSCSIKSFNWYDD